MHEPVSDTGEPFAIQHGSGPFRWSDYPMLSVALDALALVMTGLFPVLNPIGASLIARSLTPHLDDTGRARLARSVAINSFVILTVSVLVGTYILSFFGISEAILRVAGGLVVAYSGWRLLQAPSTDMPNAPVAAGDDVEANAFYPITLPMTVGPGSISVAIALGTEAIDDESIAHFAGVGVAFLLLSLIVYACMRYVCKLHRFIGVAGSRIVDRLFAFILLCIGMQIGWRGILELSQ
ncbi:MarC family protein [Dyella sp. C11]|uniref:MarC family protein n=1 Tax=Dyella sp. C11 TaxID=2126991 RepID=UPI001E296ABE|nr:MarC family protein [Dyella sp. C11]